MDFNCIAEQVFRYPHNVLMIDKYIYDKKTNVAQRIQQYALCLPPRRG